MSWESSSPFKPMLLVVGGVILAVSSAYLSTKLLPDDNHVIPPPNVGEPLDASVTTTHRYDPGEVERGRVYYAQLCISCHGVRGDGLGEWAYRVTPYPADLRKARTQQRSDQMLFDIVSDGLLGTPMIGWKQQLTEAQRWQLVIYMRTLVKQKDEVESEVDGQV